MTPQGLLDLWSGGAAAPPRVRAHHLAAAADGLDADALARWPLGEWHVGLVRAWRMLLDTPLDAIANCPSCDALCEVEIAPDALPVSPARSPTAVVVDGGERIPRLLTPADLDAVAGLDHGQARAELARRALDVADVPDDLQRAVAGALEEADPSASWWVELRCPDCAQAWEEPLDLAAFVWEAVDDAAGRLLADVADLATAFGWTEPDVLALPPARRAAYLELASR